MNKAKTKLVNRRRPSMRELRTGLPAGAFTYLDFGDAKMVHETPVDAESSNGFGWLVILDDGVGLEWLYWPPRDERKPKPRWSNCYYGSVSAAVAAGLATLEGFPDIWSGQRNLAICELVTIDDGGDRITYPISEHTARLLGRQPRRAAAMSLMSCMNGAPHVPHIHRQLVWEQVRRDHLSATGRLR